MKRHGLSHRALAAAACLLALAGCGALQPATMRLPAGLETRTEPASIDGLGGGTRGRFTLAGNGGTYTRSANRLALFDEIAVFHWGGAAYAVGGADFAAPVNARCTLRQASVSLDIVEFRPKKLAYECDFDGLDARLSLQESAGGITGIGRSERRGRITLAGTAFALRSVHDLAVSPLQLAFPIGYLIEHDGRPIAAVELNGSTPRLHLPSGAPAPTKQAVVLAALALAVLWDPAAM